MDEHFFTGANNTVVEYVVTGSHYALVEHVVAGTYNAVEDDFADPVAAAVNAVI